MYKLIFFFHNQFNGWFLATAQFVASEGKKAWSRLFRNVVEIWFYFGKAVFFLLGFWSKPLTMNFCLNEKKNYIYICAQLQYTRLKAPIRFHNQCRILSRSHSSFVYIFFFPRYQMQVTWPAISFLQSPTLMVWRKF